MDRQLILVGKKMMLTVVLAWAVGSVQAQETKETLTLTLDKALEIAARKAELKGYTIVSYPTKKDILSTLLDVQPNNYVESQVLKSQLGDYYKDFNLLRNIKERAMIQARVPFELNVK